MITFKIENGRKKAIYKEEPIEGIDALIAEELSKLIDDKLLLAIKLYGIDNKTIKRCYSMKYNISENMVKRHYYSNKELQNKLK